MYSQKRNLFVISLTIMKNVLGLLLSLVGIFVFSSCNKDEGLGGSSSIQGYIYNIVYQSDNYSFKVDTIPAVGERVYIVYSDNDEDPVADKDVRTNLNGMFNFDFLRKGNYIVYALSQYPEELNDQKIAETKHVKVGSGISYAEPIYIRSGEGYGLSIIKGKLLVQYWKGYMPNGEPEAAAGERVYLKRLGEDAILNDARVSDQGVFVFDKIPPGQYEVYSMTQEIANRRYIYPTEAISIEVKEPHKVYELPETITIDLNL